MSYDLASTLSRLYFSLTTTLSGLRSACTMLSFSMWRRAVKSWRA